MTRAFFRVILFASFLIVLASLIQLLSLVKLQKKLKSQSELFTPWIYRFLLKVVGVKVICDENSLHHIKKSPQLILSNHISYLDVIVLGSLLPTRFLAKEEVGRWPVIGLCTQVLGCLYVRREDLLSKVKVLYDLESGLAQNSYTLFPEGTTTDAMHPGEDLWNEGNVWAAQSSRAPLLCAGIAYSSLKNVAWIGEDKFLPHLWNLFKVKKIICNVTLFSMSENEVKNTPTRELSRFAFFQVCRLSQESFKNLEEEKHVSIQRTNFVSTTIPVFGKEGS